MNTLVASIAALAIIVSGALFWIDRSAPDAPATAGTGEQAEPSEADRQAEPPNDSPTEMPEDPAAEMPTANTANEEAAQAGEPVPIRVETVAEGLEVPWAIAWTDTDRMLVTERPGRVRVIIDDRLQAEPLHVFSEVISAKGNETGLMSLAVDPDYQENRFLYFSLAYEAPDGLKVKIVRLRDEGSRLADETVILDDIPAARYHAGSRLAFGPEGKLYATTGDALNQEEAQNIESLAGKTLRLDPDGSIPADNPFPDSPVWSYGHRNAQGISWHPDNGEQYQTEHGPSGFDGPPGGDEINRIVKGQNYGWPLVSHQDSTPEAKDPLVTFTPAKAPASAAFYTGKNIPRFTDCLFFGGLRGEGLFCAKIAPDSPDTVQETIRIEAVDFGRIRPVAMGPDGLLYFATSNRDGRGKVATTDDRVFRIVPETGDSAASLQTVKR